MKKQRLHKVVIEGVTPNPNAGVRFEAYLRDGLDYIVRVSYDTLFKEILDWRGTLSQILVGATETASIVGIDLFKQFENYFDRIVGMGLSWTRKVGGIPEHLTFTIPCRLWVEESSERDIMRELDNLYKVTIPDMGRGVAMVKQHVVMVQVGNWFLMENAYVSGINHRWSKTLIDGVPAWCDVDIDITSIYATDYKQLNIAGSKVVVRKLEG